MRYLAVCLALAPLLAGAAEDPPASPAEPAAVPYRPSVSTPAALSAPGWLEIEAGVSHEHAPAGERRDSIPYTLKLALTPDWGVRVGGDAWARRTDGSGRASGFGDTAVVVKRCFAVDDSRAFGLEAGATLSTGHRGAGSGSGKADYGLNAIYSADFEDWHTDVNLVPTRLGQVDPGASRTSVLAAVAVSHPLGESWGAVAELSGTHQKGAENSRQLLAAFSYNASKRLVFDFGGARSLRSGSAAWSAVAGFTWTAARLF